jgi:hypothetical protein
MAVTAASKVDPFSREFLSDPYPFHEELRAPERRLNNTLRGLARLPVRVRPS